MYNRIRLGEQVEKSTKFLSKPWSYRGSASLGWLVCEYVAPEAAFADPFTGVLNGDGELRAAGPLYFWSYVYYLSKYYELLDTILSLGRGRCVVCRLPVV